MVRVLIAADIAFYRDGLQHLLRERADTEVVGAVAVRHDIVPLLEECRPDVVLFDVDAPLARHWVDHVRALVAPPKLVALAVTNTPEGILRWAEAGISAYVTRDATIDELHHVVHGAARDEAYCSPQIAACLLRRLNSLAAQSASAVCPIEALTAREQQILQLLSQGLSNKAIARQLNISTATAKNHVHNILEKMHLKRRAEVAKLQLPEPLTGSV